MIKIVFNEEAITALRYWRFQHPDPRVQVRMEALYLRSQGVANAEILRLCGISKASSPSRPNEKELVPTAARRNASPAKAALPRIFRSSLMFIPGK